MQDTTKLYMVVQSRKSKDNMLERVYSWDNDNDGQIKLWTEHDCPNEQYES